jgi:hypothetical protein
MKERIIGQIGLLLMTFLTLGLTFYLPDSFGIIRPFWFIIPFLFGILTIYSFLKG